MPNITDGKRVFVPEDESGRVYNQARRLYDRLRKRSYRTADAWDVAWREFSRGHYDWRLFRQHERRTWVQHTAYVQGVRDTLNELLGSEFD